jgi:hypothetical protein
LYFQYKVYADICNYSGLMRGWRRHYCGAIGGMEGLLAGRGLPLNEPLGAKGFNAATKRERFLCPFVRDPAGPQALENTYKYHIYLS